MEESYQPFPEESFPGSSDQSASTDYFSFVSEAELDDEDDAEDIEETTTPENLKRAIEGEMRGIKKYTVFAKIADDDGNEEIGRLFKAAADAEQTHLDSLLTLIKQFEPDYEQPEVEEPETFSVPLCLIDASYGEQFESSDLYPSFITVADKGDDNDNTEVIRVLTNIANAEASHAARFITAYNNLHTPEERAYYVCPTCGFIAVGEGFNMCPICGVEESDFKKF